MPNYGVKDQGSAGPLQISITLKLREVIKDFSQFKDFVAKSGLAEGTATSLVRGDGNPTIRTIEKLAEALDMDVFDLIGATPNHVDFAEVRKLVKAKREAKKLDDLLLMPRKFSQVRKTAQRKK